MSFACTRLGMTPAEALVAATVNAAWAIGEGRDRGSLDVGKRADIVVFEVENHRQIPYFMGVNAVRTVVKNGLVVVDGKVVK
jgi:imidazolonepropionase